MLEWQHRQVRFQGSKQGTDDDNVFLKVRLLQLKLHASCLVQK